MPGAELGFWISASRLGLGLHYLLPVSIDLLLRNQSMTDQTLLIRSVEHILNPGSRDTIAIIGSDTYYL